MSLILPYDQWPASDRTMWTALRKPGGPFDDRGALTDLRETSMETLQNRYGRWLEWLRRSDPAALEAPPAVRVTLPRLASWLEALAHTAPMSRLMFVDGVLRIASAAAPEADWTCHRRVKAKLQRAAARGDPARKAGRVLSSRMLLDAGRELAGPGAEAATTPLQRAVRHRNGTMVAFLAMIPIRRRAFAGLRIGKALIITPEVLILDLPGDLTKNRLPYEGHVGEPVAGLMRSYLEQTRPFLLARGEQSHDWLWVGDRGQPLSYAWIGPKIAGITERLTGKRIPPHFFRDAAATTLAHESPEAARMIGPVLGHTATGTAERHYIQADSVEAARDYAAVVRELRGKR